MMPDEVPAIVKPLLRDALGVPLIAYILGASEPEVDDWLSSDLVEFGSARQMQVLGELHKLINFYGSQNVELQQHSLASIFSTYLDDSGTTIGNMLRMMTVDAAVLPLVDSGHLSELGEISEILAALTRDIYPIYLLPSARPRIFMSANIYGHPLRKRFESVLMSDNLFKNFFVQGDPEFPTGFYAVSTGQASGAQLVMLAQTLIASGWRRARLSSTETPTLEWHIACVLKDFEVFRAALRNQATEVPVVVGLTGFLLDFEGVIDLGWGVLRKVDERDRIFAPSTADDTVSGRGSDGDEVAVSYGGSAVLETTLSYRLFRRPENEFFTEWPPELLGHEVVQRYVESLQLGALLSQEIRNGDPIAVLDTWAYIHDPLAPGYNVSWRDPRMLKSFMPRKVSSEDGERWRVFAAAVEENRTKYVNVAIKRVLRAAAERRDHSDVLVDTVIAWENLFGGRSAKTITITGGLAWLIADNYSERRQLRREFVDIYGIRSSVVHGEDVDPRELAARASRALVISIEALKILFTVRLDLLRECDGGDDRSLRLLMGG